MTLRHLLSSCCLALLPVVAGGVAQANPYADHLAVRLLPGWKQADGSHIAGLEFQLSQGWKTYWRAPGDAGVPPVFDWSASQNVARVDVIWPTPHVFWQNGMRSIGYSDRVVLPLRIEPSGSGAVHLDGVLQVGICSDICVPLHVDLSTLLLPPQGRRDPAIAASLAERPFSGAEAGVRDVTCQVEPKGRKMRLRAEIVMPAAGADEVVVVETRDPNLWVSEAKTRRQGDHLTAEAVIMPMSGGAMMFDRSSLNLTVLGGGQTIEIEGCAAR